MSDKPLMAACTLTNNSGNEVANETTVIPITSFDNFSLKESATDERTKNSPPITKSEKPRITRKMLTIKKNFCEDTVLNIVTALRVF